MLTPTRGISLDTLFSAPNPSSLTRTTLNDSTTSFAQQLADSLGSYLSQASAGAHIEIDISPQTNSNSGTRQFIVTVKDPSTLASIAPAQAPPPSRSPVQIDVSGMLMFSGIPQIAPETDPVAPPITDEADAYWAAQPEQVRVLRTIEDPVERAEMGMKLAQQGFSIDDHIMIQRWDPYMTMKVRQDEGYSWVPALGQGGIGASPGISFPGLVSYDPLNPPPGAIRVSTDFALGLEHTSPFGRGEHPNETGYNVVTS